MKSNVFSGVLLGVYLAAPAAVLADIDVDSKGELGLETRVFTQDGEGDAANVSMIGRITVDAEPPGPFEFRVRAFARHDGLDRQRSAFFPEEAYGEFKKDRLRIRLGYQMENWTATEAFHPADAINSRYFDGNVQNPEKLGELMAAVRVKFLDGNVEGYFMPLFTEPILPSPNSRFRFSPLGVSLGDSLVIDHRGELTDSVWLPQWAVRVQQTIGRADVSAHVMQHVDRSLPLVFLDPRTFSPQIAWQHATQLGGTYQQVFGTVILKVEAAYRRFTQPDGDMTRLGPVPDRDHTLAAVGIEWGFGHKSGGESTFLAEAESAFGLDDDQAGILLFQRDVLVGWRYDFGDAAGQTFTTSIIVDLEKPEQVFGSLEYNRRLGETWTTQTGLRVIRFPPEDPANPVGPEFLDNANYVYLNLTRYF